MAISICQPEAGGLMRSPHNPENAGCDCEQCEMISCIVRYMLFWMPPTDRALRLPPERD